MLRFFAVSRVLPTVFLLAIFFCQADLLKPVSYTFAMQTLIGSLGASDPNFSKLTDGKIGSSHNVIWRRIENSGLPNIVSFDFQHDVSLSKITVHYYRGKRSYGIKDIKVIGINTAGQRLPMGLITLNQPYERPEQDKAVMAATINAEDERPVRQVEITINGTGGYIAVSEIEFEGKEIKPAVAAVAKTAKNSKYDFLPAEAAPGLRLKKADNYAVLENDHVIYVIDAGCGGTVNYAYDKHGQINLVKIGEPGAGYGTLATDRFWPGSYAIRDMYRDLPYDMTIVADQDNRKVVKVSSNGKSGFFLNVVIEKTYTLTADSSVLTIDYKISNDKANMIPLEYGLWFFSAVETPTPYERIFPGRAGVEHHPGVGQFTSRALSRGWYGVLCQDNGLAIMLPYDLFKEFYCWSSSETAGSIECKLGVYPIAAGDDLRFSFAVCPFNNIGRPDNITKVAAGSFGIAPEYETQPTANTLKLRLFQPANYDLSIKGSRLDEHGKPQQWQALGQAQISADDSHFSLDYNLPTLTAGTWLLQAELARFGETVFSMQAATIFQKASALYELPPECEIRPDSSEQGHQVNLNFNSLEYESRHIKWARPYAPGKPKVLGVCFDKNGCREMVELAQRFDLDITTNFIGGLWRISGQVTVLSPSSCLGELQDQLKNKFDVIVVSGDLWNLLPKNLQDSILTQTEQGSGLILCAPEGHPAVLADQFSQLETHRHLLGSWEAAANNGIFSGIPFAALPPARYLPYSTTGDILATVNDQPLVVSFKHGKGVVFATSWAVDGRRRETTTPEKYERRNSPVFLPSMAFIDPQVTYDYHEYQLSMMAKMIYQAAGLEPVIKIQNLNATPGKISFSCQTPVAEKLTVEISIRDKFSQLVHATSQTLTCQAGDNNFVFDLPLSDMHGLTFVDLILRSERGTEWWGSTTYQTTAQANISNFEIEDKIWRREELVTGNVTYDGNADLTISFFDSWGNEFARGQQPHFSLPLADCATFVFFAEATLTRDGRLLDRVRLRRAVYGTTDRRHLQIVFGWPGISNTSTPAFLVSDYIERLKLFGANGSSGSGSEWEIPFVAKALRDHNLAFVSTNSSGGTGGKRPYDTNRKIESKFDLIRIPCLSQPGFKQQLREKSSSFIDANAAKYGVHTVAGPDEANMFSNLDICFSPDCQHEFRNWLKTQYDSLASLNQSWLTDFQTWDEVIAMTSEEVKARASFAPWLDHRTFNDWNRADAIGHYVQGIHDIDPQVAYSLSGTSETNPWNAWDWYLLMPHLQALSSYTGEQTIQQRCFAKGKLMLEPWIGYDRDYKHHNHYILEKLFLGATGFRIYSGRFYINPDFTLPLRAQELIQALQRYRHGIAEVIMNSEPYTYPIAFHYSPASIKINWLLGATELRRSSVTGFANLVYDAALTYDYIAYGQLEQDEILQQKYQILILPASAALSSKEIETIKAFVRGGGIVIADLLTASYDQHGKPFEQSPALELFGLTKAGNLQLQPATIAGLDANVASLSLSGLQLSVPAWESGIVAGTARPLASITVAGQSHQAAFVNQYGQGLAIYLGAAVMGTIGDWQEMRFSATNFPQLQIVRQLFTTLLTRADIHPVAQAPELKASSIQLRQQGLLRLLGITRNYQQAANLDPGTTSRDVQLDQPWHIYDLLEGNYLGQHQTFSYAFAADTQSAFALLPYQAQSLSLDVASQGERKYQISAALDAAGPQCAEHIFRIRLLDPDGQECQAASGIHFATQGRCQQVITVPLNGKSGQWTVEAEDVITRQKAVAPLRN